MQPGGVWFPSHVELEFLYGRGLRLANGKKATDADFFAKDTYTLVKVKFGEQADTSILDSPIPQGSFISDNRFAPRRSVRYRADKGVLPKDEAVMRMLEQQEQEQAQEVEQQKQQQLRKFALFGLPLGALIMGLGVVFWMRSRRSTKA